MHNSDAHTWVEAWFPRYGWYEFDPTFGIPPANEDLASSIPLVRFFSSAAEALNKLGSLGGALKAALGLALVVTIGVGFWLAWHRLRPAPLGPAIPRNLGAGARHSSLPKVRGSDRGAGLATIASETAAELIRRSVGRQRPAARRACCVRSSASDTAPRRRPRKRTRAAIEELESLAAEDGGTSPLDVVRSK